MALTQQQINNIEAFLHDKAEEAGIDLIPETFPQLLYEHWDDVINPARMAKRFKRQTLRRLRRERTRQDSDRAALDSEIAALEAELEP